MEEEEEVDGVVKPPSNNEVLNDLKWKRTVHYRGPNFSLQHENELYISGKFKNNKNKLKPQFSLNSNIKHYGIYK